MITMKTKNTYIPQPLDTENIVLSKELQELVELLSKNTHEVWSKERMSTGWTYGEERNDTLKKHPCLIPYEELTDAEQAYDRNTSTETIKVLLAMGFKISR
ncbi:RyR domain-containing protein [Eubacterium sp.]|uniref:RyR domain-containing protein n=1 Tax=Eubacterium sp. TaxID=142586 RepID=UPI002FCAB46B